MIICDKCVHKMYCIDYGRKTDKCEYFDQMTNEEWRKTCSAEEFAKWLSDIIFDNADAISKCRDKDCRSCKIGWCDKVNVLEWLKQPHTESITNCNE